MFQNAVLLEFSALVGEKLCTSFKHDGISCMQLWKITTFKVTLAELIYYLLLLV